MIIKTSSAFTGMFFSFCHIAHGQAPSIQWQIANGLSSDCTMLHLTLYWRMVADYHRTWKRAV